MRGNGLRSSLCPVVLLGRANFLGRLNERLKGSVEFVGVRWPQIDLVVGTLVRKSHTVLKAWIDRLSVEIVGEGVDEDFGHCEGTSVCFGKDGSQHHTVNSVRLWEVVVLGVRELTAKGCRQMRTAQVGRHRGSTTAMCCAPDAAINAAR